MGSRYHHRIHPKPRLRSISMIGDVLTFAAYIPYDGGLFGVEMERDDDILLW